MNWWENDLPSGASSGTDRVSQFTATYRPLAEKIGQELGVSPDILLAKFGSETGWGKSVIPGTNNLGNIKDPSGAGVYATDNMTKSRDAYRVFETPEAFGDYYTAFIKRAYPKAVGAGSDPMAFAQGLKEGVRGSYAEDPQYGPKIARATNMVTKGNTASDAGAWWSNDMPAAAAPASGGEQWWSNDMPAASATTQAAPKAATAPTPEKKKDEPRSVMRRVDDFVRGIADTVTFGYADEFAAKMDQLTGLNTSNSAKPLVRDAPKLSDLVTGNNPSSYDALVKAQRERDTQGGYERVAGQVAGAFIPGTAAVGAVRAVPTAGRLARIGAGAVTGAIQGGLYGSGSAEDGQRLEGAAKGASIGAATGGILGGLLPASQSQKAGSFIKNSGDDAAARMDAEIITDLKKIADSSTKRGNPISTIDLNAVENKYINEVNRSINALGKVEKNFDAGPLRAALQDRRALTPDDLSPLRNSAAGNAVADAIEKAQRARSLTQAAQSSGGLMPLIREGVDFLPIPAAVNRGLKAALGGRQTREVAAQKVLKQAGTAENVLQRLGPSQASRSAMELADLVSKAQTTRKVQVDTAKLTSSQNKADKAAALVTKQQEQVQTALDAARAKTVLSANKANEQFLAKNSQQLITDRAAQSAEEMALEAARRQGALNASQAGQTTTQQTTAKLIAERQSQAEELARLAQARQRSVVTANEAGQTANQSNLQSLLAERQTQGQMEAARQQTTLRANEAGVRGNQQTSAGLVTERQTANKASEKLVSSTTAEQAALEQARAEGVRKANEASQRNLKTNQSRLLAERQAVENQTASDVIARMSQGAPATGGGSMKATVDRFARDFGLDEKGTRDLIGKLRDTVDDDGRAILDKLLKGEKVPELFKLQDQVLVPFAEKSGVARLSQPGGALSSETSRIFNPVSYEANVKNAMGALDNATNAAPTKELAQFAKSVAGEKVSADKAKAVADRLAKATDPAEISYLQQFVEPLAKFGKKK